VNPCTASDERTANVAGTVVDLGSRTPRHPSGTGRNRRTARLPGPRGCSAPVHVAVPRGTPARALLLATMNSIRSSATALPKVHQVWGASTARARPLLLVIDPDPQAAAALDDLGDRVDVCISPTAAEGLLVAGATDPDVVLLRADLSDVPAPTVVDLLDRCCQLPVIVAVDGGHSELVGAALAAGAVACVARPYRTAQLLALVSAVSPAGARDGEVPVRCGPLELSPGAGIVRLGGVMVPMPPQEFRVLHFLMAHAGRVVSQAELWEAVWGRTAPSTSNTVSVHVRRLRRRLGDEPGDPRLISTVGRSGYLLQAPAE
jgi:DNA-binding response OmpR family regulator